MCQRSEFLPPGWGEQAEPSESKTEDVRATKPHEVQLTLLVQAEDAGKAVSKILGATAVSGVTVTKLAVKTSEDGMWA